MTLKCRGPEGHMMSGFDVDPVPDSDIENWRSVI